MTELALLSHPQKVNRDNLWMWKGDVFIGFIEYCAKWKLVNMHVCVWGSAGVQPSSCCGPNYQDSDGARGQQVPRRGCSVSKPAKNNYTTQLSPLLDKTNCLSPRTRTRSTRRPHIHSPFTLRENSIQLHLCSVVCRRRADRQTDRRTDVLCVCVGAHMSGAVGGQTRSNATQLNILSAHH